MRKRVWCLFLCFAMMASVLIIFSNKTDAQENDWATDDSILFNRNKIGSDADSSVSRLNDIMFLIGSNRDAKQRWLKLLEKFTPKAQNSDTEKGNEEVSIELPNGYLLFSYFHLLLEKEPILNHLEDEAVLNASDETNEEDRNRETADYSMVDAALAKLPDDLTPYSDETALAVMATENAVVRGKDITEQEIVDGYANAIEEAFEGLALKEEKQANEEIPMTEASVQTVETTLQSASLAQMIDDTDVVATPAVSPKNEKEENAVEIKEMKVKQSDDLKEPNGISAHSPQTKEYGSVVLFLSFVFVCIVVVVVSAFLRKRRRI